MLGNAHNGCYLELSSGSNQISSNPLRSTFHLFPAWFLSAIFDYKLMKKVSLLLFEVYCWKVSPIGGIYYSIMERGEWKHSVFECVWPVLWRLEGDSVIFPVAEHGSCASNGLYVLKRAYVNIWMSLISWLRSNKHVNLHLVIVSFPGSYAVLRIYELPLC